MAAGHSVVPARWQAMFEGLLGRIAGRFGRVKPRLRVPQLMLGLLADLPRKNCWAIAEHTGDTSPDGLQHLLGRAKWDADLVRDDLRAFVLDHLADDQVVLVVDETGDLKKGTHTVGVQRQYIGTAGRIENAQVAVYLTYTSRHGHAGIDRALYLPKSWTHAEVDRPASACLVRVALDEFVPRAGEADFKSFQVAHPALASSLCDPGEEVVADFFDEVFGRSFCEHLGTRPEVARLFQSAVTPGSGSSTTPGHRRRAEETCERVAVAVAQ